MNARQKNLCIIVCVIIILFIFEGCATQLAYSVQPTYTVLPTYTPVIPTSTPAPRVYPGVGKEIVGKNWKVKVNKVDVTNDYFRNPPKNKDRDHFVVINLDFENTGPFEYKLSIDSVLLIHSGDEDGLIGPRGLIHTPYFIKSLEDEEPTDMNFNRVTYTKQPGGKTSGIDFVFEYEKEFNKFLLFFPELSPIAINLQE